MNDAPKPSQPKPVYREVHRTFNRLQFSLHILLAALFIVVLAKTVVYTFVSHEVSTAVSSSVLEKGIDFSGKVKRKAQPEKEKYDYYAGKIRREDAARVRREMELMKKLNLYQKQDTENRRTTPGKE